jgi:ribosomal protein S13
MFTNHLYGLGQTCQIIITKRLELTTFASFISKKCYVDDYIRLSSKTLVKTINIIFSQISNVNSSLIELKKINIIRKYLVKTYQGYCHAIGKPVRGQRS